MTERTCNIIQACKGSLYPQIDDRIMRVKSYMAEECGCDIDTYTDDVLESILKTAVYDYIDTCDRPSTFLRLMYDTIEPKISLIEKICCAFTFVRMKDSMTNEYVNGFKKEFFK